jgi:cytochrome c
MLKYLNLALIQFSLILFAHTGQSETLGLGRVATENELKAWDIDIRPDGAGLPAGSGSVLSGEETYTENCASCHGDFGEGIDRWPELAGGFDTLDSEDPVKTIGSYWPYLSTVWDYVHRAMPFGNAQSLTDNDVYSITAYILYLNDLVEEDFELSNKNFSSISLPNENNFFHDNRNTLENKQFVKRCMQNCKPDVKITKRAVVLDVTPDTEIETEQSVPKVEIQEETASLNLQLVKDGEKVFKKCKACHKIGAKAKHGTGPHLNNIYGRIAGSLNDYKKYSKNIINAGNNGLIWDSETLSSFIENPKKYLAGTKMNFKGIKKSTDRNALLEYIKSIASSGN